MISWWYLSALFLRQPSLIAGQAFTLDTLSVPVLPSSVDAYTIAYDETNQFVYLGGTAQVSIDGEPYNGSGDFFVTKHFMNGTRVWSRLAGGSGTEIARKMIRVPETGDLFIFGLTYSNFIDNQTSNGLPDTVLVKYAQNGTKLLTRYFGRTGTCDSADGFIDAQNQQLIIGGYYNGFIGLVGIDMNNGSLMRQIVLVGQGRYQGMSPIPGSNSDFYGTGSSNSVLDGQPFLGVSDIFLFKMNFLNGTRYWTRTWGNVTDDGGQDVQFDPNNRQVYVGGYTYGNVPLNGLSALGDKDAIVICTSDNGTYLWTRRFGTSNTDQLFAVAIHPGTGTLFALGFCASNYGFVTTFAPNGTMLQMALSPGQAIFWEMALSSNAKSAYISAGGSGMLTLNISGPPFVAASRTTVSTLMSSPTLMVSTLMNSPTLIPGSAMMSSPTLIPGSATTTSIAPLLIPASTIPSLTGILTTSVLTSELLGQSSSYEGTATSTPAVGPLENVPSSPLAVLLTSLNLIVELIAVASVVLLVVLIFLCICLKMRSKQSRAAQIPTSPSGTTDMTSEFSQITTTTTDLQANATTILRSDFELSLPGYLMFESRSSFRIRKQIAKGGGGLVSTADVFTLGLSAYGSTIIVKTLGSDSGTPLAELSEREQKSFKQEIAIMHYFREEKHIAKLLGWTRDPACILMKFYPHGSSDKWIHGDAYKSKSFQVRFMNDIARGVLAMHSAGFVHCDLKPQNVLVDEDEQGWLYCCLTDFGITQVVDETSLLVKDFAVSNIRGLSIQYAAPEAFQRFRQKIPPEVVAAELVMKVDLYSLAVIMFELLERRRPWGE